jgi:hypothetical protein
MTRYHFWERDVRPHSARRSGRDAHAPSISQSQLGDRLPRSNQRRIRSRNYEMQLQ